jgi:hypothetical protein
MEPKTISLQGLQAHLSGIQRAFDGIPRLSSRPSSVSLSL